ncbi:MAG: hypothetical protein Q7S58_04285 [Candidatus Binatus sp.]|uniref:hypothetical protein n=1 Tax=Candidatus Binatus sp. TaxID=2811406 RepID=UPI002721DCF3|nr:hypothetical protein [Candidatus Binatus sp.]MDO8431610.1 hypothetical protein [Candidatus Binatus sp.]
MRRKGMALTEHLIAGSDFKRTRFHDEKGDLVDFAGALFAPQALFSAIGARYFGYRSATPWISYRAVKFLDRAIERDWRVIEFGSGMSTLWLAERCGWLHSIESDPGWYRLVSSRLKQSGSIRYELRGVEEYPDVSDYPDGSIDFALVDGIWRAGCIEQVAPKIRRGGEHKYFVDFRPCQFGVTEGLLVQF